MKTKDDILNQISRANEMFSVVGHTPDDKILEYENQLHILFPSDYRWYLQQFGAGGIGSVNILGIDPDKYIDVLKTTIDARVQGLPQNLLPILDCDEFFYCLNMQSNESENSDVIRWDKYSKKIANKADSFFDFLYFEFNRILEINQEN